MPWFLFTPPAEVTPVHKRYRQDLSFFAMSESPGPGYSMPQSCCEPQDVCDRVMLLTEWALLGIFEAVCAF